MFHIFRDIIICVLNQFSKSFGFDSRNASILIDQPRDSAHGDLYTNAALVFSKKLNVVPHVLAKAISEALLRNEFVESSSIAGAGFVNFSLKPFAWQSIINEVIAQKSEYSKSNIKDGSLINLEFVSANPTGPLHTGHARNAVFGSVAANLFEKIGYKVTKEFYINDQGNQIKSLAKSLYLRYREVLGAPVSQDDFSEDMYCGEYIKDLAKVLADIYQDEFLNKDETDWIDILGNFAVQKMMKNVESDLAMIGVVMDKYTSEAALCNDNLVEDALSILSKHGDIYEGIIPEPKGMVVEDWEERPQTLFRATKYGDDIDRPIKKSDGSWTYFAGDIAYHLNKIKRGFKEMVAVLGADHAGYVKRLKAAVNALSDSSASIDIRLYQLVNFLENGKPVRMSKRAGTFVTLKEVVERVGKDITRYMMISRHHDVMIDFDFAKVVECTMENPIFYIQYAYARICSVFKNFEANFGKIDENELKTIEKSCLTDDSEISLMKALSFWPEQVSASAIAIEPHRIPGYLQNIAYCFHSLWNKGKLNSELRFIDTTNKNITLSRLSLLMATKLVLEDGLNIIGVSPMQEMK